MIPTILKAAGSAAFLLGAFGKALHSAVGGDTSGTGILCLGLGLWTAGLIWTELLAVIHPPAK